MTGIPESTMLLQMYEGLTRLDADNNPVKAIAADWDVSEDGTEYTFHLHEDAKWANGDPLTAHDFEFAWKRALDPEMAGDYAYMFYLIEGAEAYNGGEGSVAGGPVAQAAHAEQHGQQRGQGRQGDYQLGHGASALVGC
jgi:ABC-type oligopeptide transport system substrate-binding subunit